MQNMLSTDPGLAFLLLGLSIYGITFTLADAKVLSWLRDPLIKRFTALDCFLHCYFCIGFWVSLMISYLFFKNMGDVAILAFAGSTFSGVLDMFVNKLES